MTQLVLRDRPFADAAADHVASTTDHASRPAPAGHAATIELELVTTLAAFEALEDEWNTLQAASGQHAHAFQGFNWCWHWCRHYLGDGASGPTLAIVTGRRAGGLVLIMPLVTERKAGVVELRWLGEPVSQYCDVLATTEAARTETLAVAWDFAVAQTGADVANLRRVREDAIAARLMEHLGAGITAAEEAPFLNLSNDRSFDDWEARRQPRGKKNRRRQARRLAEQGDLHFLALSGSEEAAALAGHAVRLKRETLTARGSISPALADERFERFFADAAHGRGRPPGVTVMALMAGGIPAALKILVETEDTAFLHVIVFEPRFEKCGVGGLLLEHVVRRTLLSERRELDLLPPRHAYKLDLADGTVTVRDYAVALSAKGWLYTHAFLKVRHQIKSAIEALPKPARRLILSLAGGRSRPSPAAEDHSAA